MTVEGVVLQLKEVRARPRVRRTGCTLNAEDTSRFEGDLRSVAEQRSLGAICVLGRRLRPAEKPSEGGEERRTGENAPTSTPSRSSCSPLSAVASSIGRASWPSPSARVLKSLGAELRRCQVDARRGGKGNSPTDGQRERAPATQ